MPKKQPILFHRTFSALSSSYVSEQVMQCVEDLYDAGYKQIKVIEHKIDSNDHYSTTVIASLDNVHIDIGFPPQ